MVAEAPSRSGCCFASMFFGKGMQLIVTGEIHRLPAHHGEIPDQLLIMNGFLRPIAGRSRSRLSEIRES